MFEPQLIDAALKAVCEKGGEMVQSTGLVERKREILADVLLVSEILLNSLESLSALGCEQSPQPQSGASTKE